MKDLNKLLNNKGSGLGVIFYGITLLLVLIFTAINILNSKVIEDGYNSLREAVQAASSGSVIHLLTEQVTDSSTGKTEAQKQTASIEHAGYDLYLQLALGYFINWEEDTDTGDDTKVQTGDINNFIKLDHQKVVNSTLALFEEAVYRFDNAGEISDTSKYKIMMFFIEPFQNGGTKFFDIIAYGNGDYTNVINAKWKNESGVVIKSENCKTIASELARGQVKVRPGESMKEVYGRIEATIEDIVNCKNNSDKWDGSMETSKLVFYKIKSSGDNYSINLSVPGSGYEEKIRKMETHPYYMIVVKDFALPTIFDDKETNEEGVGIWSAFNSKDKNTKTTLKTPMCALNSGKVERQEEEAGWSHDR